MRAGTIVTWTARAAWAATAVLGGAAFGDALADRSRAVQLTATTLLWLGWAVVALALAVPSTVSLTVVRSIVPAAVVVAVLAALDGDDAAHVALCLALVVLTTALVWSGELGEAFVQASAYGDERRFVLRPPVGFLLPVAVSWLVLCALAIVGPLALAAGAWAIGVPATAAAIAAAWLLGKRLHRLSRRWLVLVPAGVVIHDHVVLAETVMFRAAEVASAGLALVGTQAADLTGPAAGHAVEISLAGQETVVLAASPARPGGTALHVRSVLVAPTRPGRVLAAAAANGLPVG